MAVSKHNLWKRKKNGLMKLVRSHSEWLDRRRQTKIRKRSITVKSSQWWDKDKKETTEKPTTRIKPVASVKRTQIGKKI